MQMSRTTIATGAVVAVTAAAVVGGVAIAASGGGSSTTMYGAAGPSTNSGSSGSSSSSTGNVVLRTATATVQGTSERILVDDKGYPLYYYEPDTATQSRVAGELAVLWPPVVGSGATAQGASGKLTTVSTSNGQQVAYNGHFLYTFVQDNPGQVTGQGVQDFDVATPGLSAGPSASSAPSSSMQSNTPPASSGGGYW
jgi:predicted lipoprotein with Yx(FWY)xxD motif